MLKIDYYKLSSENEHRGALSFHIPKQYDWTPLENITPYELALCIPILVFQSWNIESLIKNLPENARRHFVEVKE